MLLGIRSKSCIRVSKADFHAKSNASTASGGKPLPIDDLVRFAIQITDALDAAHRLGIIHRDIKPSNIFIAARGEAKVLNFGLAKQLGPKTPDPLTTAETAPEPVPVSNITLTLTGVAMGTAGYMSPEQVRGEALDTRTDLFSFGLVLYEMATAKRAFAGETGPSLKDAILQKTPIPTRELAPRLPAKLAMIINKALQKDREARYQSASELRADLEALRQDLAPTRRLRKWAIAAGCAALALAVAMAGLALHRPKRAAGVRLLKQRQLTTNSSENPYRSGTISPDGKYIAYSDPMGVHIKVLATGSLTTIPQPEGFGSKPLGWEVGSWLPDSSGFMVSQDTVTPSLNYWMVTLPGGPPRKIRDDINPWSYSPVGSWLVATMNEDFSTLGGSEIWIMKPDGSQARKVYEAEDKSLFRWITWSPDGQRVAYVRDRSISGYHEVTIESRDLRGASPVTMLSSLALRGLDSLEVGEQTFVWLPDGRVIYPRGEPGANCPANLVEVRVNSHTGAAQEEPTQITNWAGFCVFGLAATADGKQLILSRQTGEVPAFVAEYDSVAHRLSEPSRFTLTEDWSVPIGWTPDSKTVLFDSNRENGWGIYGQKLGASISERLVTNVQSGKSIAVSYDSLFYFRSDSSNPPDTSPPLYAFLCREGHLSRY